MTCLPTSTLLWFCNLTRALWRISALTCTWPEAEKKVYPTPTPLMLNIRVTCLLFPLRARKENTCKALWERKDHGNTRVYMELVISIICITTRFSLFLVLHIGLWEGKWRHNVPEPSHQGMTLDQNVHTDHWRSWTTASLILVCCRLKPREGNVFLFLYID